MELVINQMSREYSREKWELKDFSLTLNAGMWGPLGPILLSS